MSIFGSVGIGSIGSWFQSTGSSIGTILLVFGIIIIIGGGAFYFFYKKTQAQAFKIHVNLFKTVAGKPWFVEGDIAREVVLPGTNVRVLFWKRKKIHSSYPTRAMGNNVFGYKINRFGELTNFDFEDTEDDARAKIDYDHRDQTYAYLHLADLINKNYKDKKPISWWQQNLPLIVVVVTTLLLIGAMWFFFSMSGKQAQQWTLISQNMKDAATQIGNALTQAKGIGSGVTGG